MFSKVDDIWWNFFQIMISLLSTCTKWPGILKISMPDVINDTQHMVYAGCAFTTWKCWPCNMLAAWHRSHTSSSGELMSSVNIEQNIQFIQKLQVIVCTKRRECKCIKQELANYMNCRRKCFHKLVFIINSQYNT